MGKGMGIHNRDHMGKRGFIILIIWGLIIIIIWGSVIIRGVIWERKGKV